MKGAASRKAPQPVVPWESVLDNYFVAAAAAQGRYIFFDDDNSDGWFYRSDHYNFVKKGVPALVVENGLHPVHPDRPNRYPMASCTTSPATNTTTTGISKAPSPT